MSVLRLYASVTEHDRHEYERLLRAIRGYGVSPRCHNDTIEFYYMGTPTAARELAGICLAVTIHSVHLGG